MKHTKTIIIILVIILIGILAIYFYDNNSNEEYNGQEKSISNYTQTEQEEIIEQKSEIKSALTEKIEPHASYYLSEVYVEVNQLIKKDTNILKYTNGEYLVAPYDCYITEIQLPSSNQKILNSHYIQIESSKMLSVSINIDEEKIDQVNIGDEATIEVTALEKKYTGYITKKSSSANNGKFEVTVEFENDDNIKLGMTGTCKISIK